MKLPENKRDRQKILAIIAVAAAGVLYGVWIGVYNPISNKRDEAAEKVLQLEHDLRTAEIQIRRMRQMERDFERTTLRLAEYSEEHMLHPRLGNYLLNARDILMGHSRSAGIGSIVIEEVGLKELPSLSDDEDAANTVQSYAVRVEAECGFNELKRLIRLIEEDNPLITVSRLHIAGQSGNPQEHMVTFDIQWPVWIDPGMRRNVMDRALEFKGGNGS